MRKFVMITATLCTAALGWFAHVLWVSQQSAAQQAEVKAKVELFALLGIVKLCNFEYDTEATHRFVLAHVVSYEEYMRYLNEPDVWKSLYEHLEPSELAVRCANAKIFAQSYGFMAKEVQSVRTP
jgi:hypothetical protein